MKIMYLQAGLGNQMFQWAFLRYLQHHGHTEIRIDASAPSLHKHTGFDLYRIFPAIKATGLLIPYWVGRPLHLLSDVLKKGFRHSLESEGEGPDKTLLPGGKPWLRGYWQEARYAEAVREQLLRDFVFTEPTDETNRELLCRIDGCEAVSIHVRGGDYLAPATRDTFSGICTPEYYREAIRRVRKKIADPVLFVFSDDPDYARQVLGEVGEAVYVTHNTGQESYRDIQLMSRCRHHILANSTFSWWGAWLDPWMDKTVHAPARWLNNHYTVTADRILPDEWIKIGG